MFFYNFKKKILDENLRQKFKGVVSAEIEAALVEEILKKTHTDFEKEYIFSMQQFLLTESDEDRLTRIKNGEFGWRHPNIKDDIIDIDEMRTHIQTPLEVEEGVIQCKKCDSRRVFSYQKQTRGCDESSTTFARCAKCGQQWTYSG